MVTAVASAEVPKFTVLIGGSFGAGNYGMCGRAYSPALPVHLAEQPHQRDGRRAGGQRAGHRPPRRPTAGRPGDEAEGVQGADPRAATRPRATPTSPPRGCGTTAIIDPAQTRDVLGLAISAALNAPIPATRFGVFRM